MGRVGRVERNPTAQPFPNPPAQLFRENPPAQLFPPVKMFQNRPLYPPCDNTNVESRTLSVVKYVINKITSTALTGRRKTATYLHLVRELMYKIEWPPRRRLRIDILCTYRNFVRALPIFCD